MASISIRNVKQETYEALKQKALGHGVSMEEEIRRLLDQVHSSSESITATFRRYFGPQNGVELDSVLEEHRKPHEPMSFEP